MTADHHKGGLRVGWGTIRKDDEKRFDAIVSRISPGGRQPANLWRFNREPVSTHLRPQPEDFAPMAQELQRMISIYNVDDPHASVT